MSTTHRATYGSAYEKEDGSAGQSIRCEEEDLFFNVEEADQSQQVLSTTKKSMSKRRRLAAQRALALAEEEARILAEMYDGLFAEEVPLQPQPSPLQQALGKRRTAAFETPQVVPTVSSKKRRSSEGGGGGVGIATGIHSTFTDDVDERPISRITDATASVSLPAHLTSPSSIADLVLKMSGLRCLKTFIARKYWEGETSGFARSYIALLESGDYVDSAQRETLLRQGYFTDPLSASDQMFKVCTVLPCTTSNAEMIAAYLIFKASNEVAISGIDPCNKANLILNVFGLPPLQANIYYSFQSGVEGYDPCQIGYIESMEKMEKPVDVQRAMVMAMDSRAYLASKISSLRDLGSMWCKADLGRDFSPPPLAPPPPFPMQTSLPTSFSAGGGAGASSRRGTQYY